MYSFSNWFICFDFAYFFCNKEFFAFLEVFSTFHIAQVIIKLIIYMKKFLDSDWLRGVQF